MSPPDLLYKYRSISTDDELARTIRLVKGEVYAAAVSSLNDPFDSAPAPGHRPPRHVMERYVREATDRLSGNRATRAERRRNLSFARNRVGTHSFRSLASGAIEQTVSEAGILCLTEDPAHMLMWGHYAVSHQGVCVEFCTENPTSLLSTADKVIYKLERPRLQWPIVDVQQMYNNLFLHKADCWSYEREWRVVLPHGVGAKQLPARSVVGLLLGARCPDGRAAELISGLSPLERAQIRIRKMHLHSDEYRLEEGR